jgi:phosphomannomutase
MTLITSISGIRGTIGGLAGAGLTPPDIVKYTAAFARFLKDNTVKSKIAIGRDARLSGEMVQHLVAGTLCSMGFDVLDAGLSTTPTIELAVVREKAAGGIIITASHNPKQWNALKLLNAKGEFISDAEGSQVLEMADDGQTTFAEVGKMGKVKMLENALDKHIEAILKLPLVKPELIKAKNFKIVVDAVNSSGGIAVPRLLRALGVQEIIELNCEPTGKFAHNPEPLPENLGEMSGIIKHLRAHLGIAVDPDVDRLALVCEDGSMFGEEYTLVAVADYILKNTPGTTVSNLSSTKALKDITEKAGQKYFASAVGEVNVVEMMKEHNAVIGGEGNGGIIYPELHYGRDALVGIALFLSHLASNGKSAAGLKHGYPNYVISKNKIELTPELNPDDVMNKFKEKYSKNPMNTVDGLKIEFGDEWVHLRKSNTEPIIRIYAESTSTTMANNLAEKIKKDIRSFI